MTGIVLDTSAVVAIIQGEPGAERLVAALERADTRSISAAGAVEAGIVLQARFGDHGERELDAFLLRARVDVVAVSAEHADLARQAFRRFGKGRHPAGLNFGDCFAYALAKSLGAQLLLLGEDFGLTDLEEVEGALVRAACERQYGMAGSEERLQATRALAALDLPVGSPAQLERESVPPPDDILR